MCICSKKVHVVHNHSNTCHYMSRLIQEKIFMTLSINVLGLNCWIENPLMIKATCILGNWIFYLHA